MSCGHVCASLLWLGGVTGSCGVILGLLHFIDADFGKMDLGKIRRLWITYSLVVGMFLFRHLANGGMVVWVAYGILAIYLILCSVMDWVLQMVCDFFHYIGLLGGLSLLLCNLPQPGNIYSLLLFVGTQWVLFRKMYGPADVAAFMVCAVYLTAEGKGMQSYLVHMLVTFVFLGVVQACKKNISRSGNLKRPVALLPYITASFFLII